MIHQPSLEAILREGARALPHFDLKPGWRFLAFREQEFGVATTIDAGGTDVTLRSRFLVGADGARSPVREAAGIGLDDLHFDEQWLVIDALVHAPERLPKINLQICDPARPTTCVLMGSGRHRWEFMVKPGENPEQLLDDATIATLLKPWNVDGAVTVERKVVYRFNARVATHWRRNAILLAGDAAHLTPPFAGQGMCAGIRDAANLAWKLAAVIRGNAPERLLDTYQTERDPHARAYISLAMMMGRTVCITDPEAAEARDAQMLAARARGAPPARPPMPAIGPGCALAGAPGAGGYFLQPMGANGARLDDVLGPGAWLIENATALTTGVFGLRHAHVNDASLAPFRASLVDWFTRHDAKAVLVRPDRYIFGAGDADTLARAWRNQLQ